MAIPQNTGARASMPLVPFASNLFREYSPSAVNMPSIFPFLAAGQDGRTTNYWKVPNFKHEADRWTAALAFGRRAAAAVVLGIQRNSENSPVTVMDVVLDPAFVNARGFARIAANNFLHQINAYLWACSQQFSPSELASFAEAQIAEEKNVAAEDRVSIRTRKAKERAAARQTA